MSDDALEEQGRVARPEEPRVSELFHENSKQRAHDLNFARRIYSINNSAAVHAVAANAFRNYPGAPLHLLPHAHPANAVEQTVARRRSVRRFTGAPLSLGELSRLLAFTNGLTGRLDPVEGQPDQPLRAAPSGGALYPVEVYVVVQAVAELSPGVYHYRVDAHGLELLLPGVFTAQLGEITSDPATFAGAAATFVLTAVFDRSHFKYGERAYRFTLLEAGHICQNLLLTATAVELGAVAVGGFLDDDVHELIGVDGVDEASIYLVPVGRPAPHRAPPTAIEEQDHLMAQLLNSLSGSPEDGR